MVLGLQKTLPSQSVKARDTAPVRVERGDLGGGGACHKKNQEGDFPDHRVINGATSIFVTPSPCRPSRPRSCRAHQLAPASSCSSRCQRNTQRSFSRTQIHEDSRGPRRCQDVSGAPWISAPSASPPSPDHPPACGTSCGCRPRVQRPPPPDRHR